MTPARIINKTINPIVPLRLSWRISHIKKTINGNTKIAQNINEGAPILLNYYLLIIYDFIKFLIIIPFLKNY